MAIEDSPEARLRYGEELRARREGAGLTQEELSARAIMSRTHIAHIEAGRRRPSLDDAQRLDEILGTGGMFVRFLPVKTEAGVAEHFAEIPELEKRATMIRTFASQLVPGMLQTKAYAHSLFMRGHIPWTEEEIEKLIGARLARARVLANFQSPDVWFVLDEVVLRRPVGTAAVMCEQLRHIEQLVVSRRIRVHVMPLSVGYYPLLAGFVSLMWFDDLPPVAYVETLKHGKVLELPSAVRSCQSAYDRSVGDAMSSSQSLALIRSLAEEFEREQHQ
ncbi:Scr1 family TA system antitoxin-like transcriptional regulator [Streptomyces alboflavus]|uniref:helix-turn-helix domain-containing protein n=1 Tax=Streptomyces alboflavus TaxID=67267 RepID=UPI0036B1714E